MNDNARARVLTWLAVAGIGVSALIMIALSLLRDSWGYPPVVLPPEGRPGTCRPLTSAWQRRPSPCGSRSSPAAAA